MQDFKFPNYQPNVNAMLICCLSPVWPDLVKFCRFVEKFPSIWQIFDSLFLVWQNAEHTLAILCHYWAYFHCCKWPNIDNYFTHLCTLTMTKSNLSINAHWKSLNGETTYLHINEQKVDKLRKQFLNACLF